MNDRRKETDRLLAELRRSGIRDEGVLEAMAAVDRRDYVAAVDGGRAYENRPLAIGAGQTISQPLIVAVMTEALACGPGCEVLEIGTGSGYQAAILAELGCRVHSVERIESLHRSAKAKLAGMPMVSCHLADGSEGWPEAAPYDGIVVTAAPQRIETAWIAQLKPGGRLVVPLDEGCDQQLLRIIKTESGETRRETLGSVRFVPLLRGLRT